MIFLTETWLTSEKYDITAEVKDYGYVLLHKNTKNREKDRVGGFGTLVKGSIVGKQLVSKDFHSFEHNLVKIPLESKQMMILIPVHRLQFVPVGEFLEEFEDRLEKFAVFTEDFIIAGDVNIHTKTDMGPARKFDDLLDMFDLKQNGTNAHQGSFQIDTEESTF